MPKLYRSTPRLIVRPLEKKDYLVWRQAFEEMKPPQNIWDRPPKTGKDITRKAFNELLRKQAKRRKDDFFFDFAIFEKKTGKMVGAASLMEISRALAQTAFLGYGIYNNFWGKGYGKEGVSAVIRIGFEDVKLHRIEAGIEPRNRRSIMLARSLGLRKEGLKKRYLFWREKWLDLVMYSGTCEDFNIKWRGKTAPFNR